MDSSTTTPRLLRDLGPIAVADPVRAARTAAASRLARRAVQPSTAAEADRSIRTCLLDRLGRLLDGGWRVDEIERVLDLRCPSTNSAAVLADLAAMRSDGATEGWWGDRRWLAARLARDPVPTVSIVGVAALYTVVSALEPLPLFDPSETADLDDAVLRKVRALLAKAESTDFPDEADALTAKAQDLITRHALDAMSLGTDQRSEVRSRRIALDAPYVDAKAILLTQIAVANRCKSVHCRFTDTAIVIGTPSDLSAVEVLYTSLLTQATSAMLASGSVEDRRGCNRTRSFRRSFLMGFACRIGARLAEATDAAVDERSSGSLLPALRARSEAVDDAVSDAFPGLSTNRVTHSNLAGYGAGDRAGSTADLGGERVKGAPGELAS